MAKLRAVECREFIEAAVEKAAEVGVPVSVALVNAEGHLIAMERMDEAGFLTADIAISKAFTVAAFRSMSPRFPDGLTIQHWFRERNPQMLINASVFTGGKVVVSGGCMPVFKGDEMVGAFGISGGTSDEDQVIADHVVQKLGWAVTPAHDTTPPEVKANINRIYESIGLDRRV